MKIIKRILVAIGALVALAVIGVSVKFYTLAPEVRAAPNVRAPRTAEAVARGRYLAHHVTVCVGCHSPVREDQPGEPLIESRLLSGRDFGNLGDPSFPGKLRAPNLTPDRETGIGSWTDGEIVRATREGVGRDGRALFPMMPYQTYARTLSDADTLAIVAYLRSVPAVRRSLPRTELGFPLSMFIRTGPKPLERPSTGTPERGLERGRWLLDVASCGDCHDTMDDKRNPVPGHRLAGGNPFPIPGRGMLFVPNITSDRATGIGSYSDEDMRRALFEGIGKDGRRLFGMPWLYYAGMTEDDRTALVGALRQVSAVSHVVPASDIRREPAPR